MTADEAKQCRYITGHRPTLQGRMRMRETITYSDCCTVEERPSEIAPSKTITITHFKCPRCDAPHKDLEHGMAARCGNCCLEFIRYGNTLEMND